MRKDAAGPERPRKRYRVRNWREYDRGLIGRGDLTLWFSPDSLHVFDPESGDLFDHFPRISGDHSYYPTILAMKDGDVKGCFAFGQILVLGHGDAHVSPILYILVFGCPVIVFFVARGLRAVFPRG